jgi:DNA-binding MarR family transcriptional regulator
MYLNPRTAQEAERYLSMTTDERKVYELIKASGRDGTWIKTIKEKSQLHTKIVNDSIKSLEKKQIIKSIKSVKAPSKKVYILFDIEPSTELTGGTWYTDTSIDTTFIQTIHTLLHKYLMKKTTMFQGVGVEEVTNFVNGSGVVAMGGMDSSDVEMVLERLVADDLISKHSRIGTLF